MSKGKILIKGPLAPGRSRSVHVAVKSLDEKPASAKCESKKIRIQWVLWSHSSRVNLMSATKDKWAKLDGKFDRPGDCGHRREEAYRKKLEELRKKYPDAKRRGYTLLYSAGGKRWSEGFQCAQTEVNLNRLKR